MSGQTSVVRSSIPAIVPDMLPGISPSTAIGGSVIVSESALPDGAATAASQATLLTELQAKADLTETQPVKLIPATSGGQASYTSISAASVLALVVKASPGQIYGYSFFNNTAAAIFIRLYNMTTAPAGTDTPVRRIMVPANGSVERSITGGIAFSTGIGIRATVLAPDNDATALTADTVLFNVDYT